MEVELSSNLGLFVEDWNNAVDIDVQKDDPKSTEDEKTEARNEDEDSDKKDEENLMSHAAGRDAENLTSAD